MTGLLPTLDNRRVIQLLRALDLFDRARCFLFRSSGSANRAKSEADRELTLFYRRVWHDAAHELGARVEPLGSEAYAIHLNGRSTFVLGNTTEVDTLATHRVARSKAAAYKLLIGAGLPVPRHRLFSLEELESAWGFVQEITRNIGQYCVVKPASDSGGGLGVTTGIRSRFQLARAAWGATRWGAEALIEEQIPGANYRLLYLDGQLLDSVGRKAPVVHGDGKGSVERLIRDENARRVKPGSERSHDLISIDLELRQTLKTQGLNLSSVPAAHQEVRLKTVINQNGRSDNYTATGQICPALIAEGAMAARATGVRLAGVDILTTDPSVPLAQSGGVVLEVNPSPGFFWHYCKSDGSFPVAVHVLNRLLAQGGPKQ